MALSGGQQQRLCIARAIATKPDVILMDEPCSALDPIATTQIEDLMRELVAEYTIVIVTHNMQQAARVVRPHGLLHGRGRRGGQAHRRWSSSSTRRRRSSPTRRTQRTEAYVTGGSDDPRVVPRSARSAPSSSSLDAGRARGRRRSSDPSRRSSSATPTLAQRVIADDDRDRRAVPSDRLRAPCRCWRCSRRSPRTCGSISAILHSCLHLERIGDQAVNVAKLYLMTRDLPGSDAMREMIGEMGERVVLMIRTAMEAFANRDLERCLQLPRWTISWTG